MIYGFIGLGNMAGAIIRGMAGSGNFSSDTLCGFNRRIDRSLTSMNVENLETLEKTLDYFKEVR